jgi:hypothetical protein
MDAKLFPVVRWCLPGNAYDFLLRRIHARFQP